MQLIIVTGLSGAGKSIALDTLEDLGFYCVDNLPVPLLPALGEELLRHPGKNRPVAVGIDARSEAKNLRQIPALIETLRRQGFDAEVFFLEADDEILIMRYSETRRKHPLSDTAGSLSRAIELDRQLLGPLAESADLRINTSRTHIHQLRRLLRDRFSHRIEGRLSLQFLSFGFKFGVPTDVDYVFDVRCLPNPHWEPGLRDLTGKDEAVASYLEADDSVGRMREDIANFLDHWMPAFDTEGRSYLTVAVGCTGGRHRSVYLVETLGKRFHQGEHPVSVRHRELP
jgi:UPF0042 nucleotide-binding protein